MKRKNNLKNLFALDLKRFLIIIGIWILSVILHNLIYALFGVEEAFFFIMAVFVIPLYFIIAFIHSIIKMINKKK